MPPPAWPVHLIELKSLSLDLVDAHGRSRLLSFLLYRLTPAGPANRIIRPDWVETFQWLSGIGNQEVSELRSRRSIEPI